MPPIHRFANSKPNRKEITVEWQNRDICFWRRSRHLVSPFVGPHVAILIAWGRIAPWFNCVGGGHQALLSGSVSDLIQDGYLDVVSCKEL